MLPKDAQHGQLRHNGLAGPRRGSQQRILICVVQRVEGLGLDGIEVAELVEGLEGRLIQG